MKARPKSETVDAYRVNDDNLAPLLRKLTETHKELVMFTDDELVLEWDGPVCKMSAAEGEYVIFSDTRVIVLTAAEFEAKYEAEPEVKPYRWNEYNPFPATQPRPRPGQPYTLRWIPEPQLAAGPFAPMDSERQ